MSHREILPDRCRYGFRKRRPSAGSAYPRHWRRPTPEPGLRFHRELKATATLQLLWEEYHHPTATQFCEIYRQWARRLRPSMRQSPRRREDLHRLLRQAAEPGRPAHGGAAACRAPCSAPAASPTPRTSSWLQRAHPSRDQLTPSPGPAATSPRSAPTRTWPPTTSWSRRGRATPGQSGRRNRLGPARYWPGSATRFFASAR